MPTVPATNRCGWSKKCTWRGITASLSAAAGAATRHRVRTLLGTATPLRRQQVVDGATHVVQPNQERPQLRVAHDAHRRRVEHDALEQIERQPDRVGDDSFEYIGVR